MEKNDDRRPGDADGPLLGSETNDAARERQQGYQVFLAAPMSGLEGASYSEFRRQVLRFKEAMAERWGLTRIYCALDAAPSADDFQTEDAGVARDLSALRNSERFVMLFPSPMVSSVLVEAGYAIALEIPCVIFTPRADMLPFMLRKASDAFDFVRCVESRSVEEATQMLGHSMEQFFRPGAPTT